MCPARRGHAVPEASPGTRCYPTVEASNETRQRFRTARRSASGTMPKLRATAQPVWVVDDVVLPARPGAGRRVGERWNAAAHAASPEQCGCFPRRGGRSGRSTRLRGDGAALASQGRSAGASGLSQSPNWEHRAAVRRARRPTERIDPPLHAVHLVAQDRSRRTTRTRPTARRSRHRPSRPARTGLASAPHPARRPARPARRPGPATGPEPARPERLGLEQGTGGRRERLGVAGPAEPLVTLGTIGWHRDEVVRWDQTTFSWSRLGRLGALEPAARREVGADRRRTGHRDVGLVSTSAYRNPWKVNIGTRSTSSSSARMYVSVAFADRKDRYGGSHPTRAPPRAARSACRHVPLDPEPDEPRRGSGRRRYGPGRWTSTGVGWIMATGRTGGAIRGLMTAASKGTTATAATRGVESRLDPSRAPARGR